MSISMRIALSATTILMLAAPAQAALVISSDATSNVTCSAGVCSATAADAVLNVTDLTTMLAAGSVTVESGSTAQDILVEAPFSWTSSNSLTLDSYRKVTVDKPVFDAGPAALNILYNDGGTGGELLFRTKGRISFTSKKNELAINGQSYTLVNSVASLASIIAKNPAAFYALKDNYNAAKDGTYGATPIPTEFTGTFEGLGSTISNLSIDCEPAKHPVSVGLFYYIPPGGAVKSLRLINIAYLDNAKKSLEAGGLASASRGYLFDDHVSGTITAKVIAGGLVGGNGPGGVVANSSANVAVNAHRSGGLVSTNQGMVIASYTTGKVAHGGGLVEANDQGTIMQSYATSKVGSSSPAPGGLVSLNEANAAIEESYSIGKIHATGLFGGFVGEADSRVFANNYWDIQTSGTDQGTSEGNMPGITGLTTAQFKSGLPAGFDPKVWAQNSEINNGYPYLIDNPPQ